MFWKKKLSLLLNVFFVLAYVIYRVLVKYGNDLITCERITAEKQGHYWSNWSNELQQRNKCVIDQIDWRITEEKQVHYWSNRSNELQQKNKCIIDQIDLNFDTIVNLALLTILIDNLFEVSRTLQLFVNFFSSCNRLLFYEIFCLQLYASLNNKYIFLPC